MRTSLSIAVFSAAIAALSAGPAYSAPPVEADPPVEPDPEPDLSSAKGLFDAGLARYAAADYAAAIDLWLESYALIPPAFENRLVKAELIYNVARAQRKWFDIDQDIRHLRQSRQILMSYLQEIDGLYPVDQAALEREKIQEQIDELTAEIDAWEAEQTRREAELAARMAPQFDHEADAREERRNKAMLGTGAGLTSLGVAGVGVLVAGLVMASSADGSLDELALESDIPERESTISRGRSANTMIIAGSVSAGVLLAAGVPLLVVGLSAEKKRKGRRSESGLEARLDGAAPMWLPGGAGLSLAGRF